MRKKMKQLKRVNEDNQLEVMPYVLSEQPWCVEKWYDEDIINAMEKAGICVNEVNFKKAKNAVLDIFDNKEDRNDLLKSCVESTFRAQYVKTDDLQYQKALSDTVFSMLNLTHKLL